MELSILNIRLILFAYMLMKKSTKTGKKFIEALTPAALCASDADERPTVQQRLVFPNKVKA